MNRIMGLFGASAVVAALAVFGCSSSSGGKGNCGSSGGGGGIGGGIGGGSTSSGGSCSSSGTGSSSSGGGGSCPAITATSTCANCLAAQCCAQATACSNDSTCVTCDDSCNTDGTCTECEQTDTAFGALATCAGNSCASQCGLTGSSSSGSSSGGGQCPAGANDTACDTCTEQNCCAQVMACNADQGCIAAANQITANCGTNATLACAQQTVQASGDTAAENLISCLENSCATPCGG
ncbi:MAG TPA: hypothetical protein VIJ22_19680 [Polyangiaceae bacterium]